MKRPSNLFILLGFFPLLHRKSTKRLRKTGQVGNVFTNCIEIVCAKPMRP
ncbi:hypothetical protein QWZ13_08645 [Reinekea marina]|nr:hypothetical protein [Reinekea marina]MDN3648977.1 hypothetical protein [Reinekea marina]